jgi:Protein of unknown function (DUF2786)
MTAKTDKMLEKVRAILALADDEQTRNPEAADNYRAKADAMMTAYAIEQWQVDQVRGADTERPKPEIRHFNFDWWYDNKRASELWWLFNDTARHCRCVVALRGHGSSGSYRAMPVIGLPSDLDYLDLMFTHLMIQMGKKLTPQVDPAAEPGQNVYEMRMAGMGWKEITRRMWVAGQAKLLRGKAARGRWDYQAGEYEEITLDTPFDRLPEAYWTGVKNNLANLNRAYVKAHGLPRNYVNPEVYQRSYADGFVNEINKRFREMDRSQAATGGSGMELAIRDIRAQAMDLYAEMWPAPEDDGKKRKGRALSRERAFSYEAAEHGAQAGREANLSNKPSARLGNRRQLPGS